MKKYRNETATRQIQDSVTVSNLKASKINTPLSLPIHQVRRRSAAASVVVSDPLNTLSILRRRIRFHCCSLCAHLPPPAPMLSSYIPQDRRLSPAASGVVSNPLNASPIPCPLSTPPSQLLINLAHLTLPTPPPLSAMPSARKHTGTSAVGDVHSDVLYFMHPQLTSLLSLSIPRDHISLPTPPLWSPFTKAYHFDASASVVIPESPIPQTYCLFLVLH